MWPLCFLFYQGIIQRGSCLSSAFATLWFETEATVSFTGFAHALLWEKPRQRACRVWGVQPALAGTASRPRFLPTL